MKLNFETNIAEGTPEELVKYQELLEGLEEEREAELLKSGHMHVGYQPSEEEALNNFKGLLGSMKVKDSYTDLTESSTEEDKYVGCTFWYIDDSIFNNRIVLKTTLWDYLEDSKGRRYTYKEVHGLTSPINKKIAREEFEEAKNNGGLLKYYSSLDVFGWE